MDARGHVTTYTHDAIGLLTKQTYPNGALVTYVYDDTGSRTRMEDGSGITTYTYNAARLLRTVMVSGRRTYTSSGALDGS